jgi:predicted dinucleotide-binding enzyme
LARDVAGMCGGGWWLGRGMQIAVIGTGNIGGTLGERWRQAGHEVVYGSRRPTADGPGGAAVVTVAEAIAGAEAVLFAVPGAAVGELVAANGAALAGKVVIDATNRIGEPVVNNRDVMVAGAPGAHYVRAFNTLGWENFAQPLPDTDLFFAADPDARATAEALITAVGLRPAYLGGAEAATTVDSLLPLWFALVKQHGGNRKVALRVID